MKPSEMLAMPAANAEPMVVYTGPKRTGAALVAAVAADEASQTVRGKKGKEAGVTVRIAAKPDPKAEAKPAAEAAASPPQQKQAAKNTAEAKPPRRSRPGAPRRTAPRRMHEVGRGQAGAAKPKPAAKDTKN